MSIFKKSKKIIPNESTKKEPDVAEKKDNPLLTMPITDDCLFIKLNRSDKFVKYNNKDLNGFYDELDQQLDLAKSELLLSFETIGNKSKENYFP